MSLGSQILMFPALLTKKREEDFVDESDAPKDKYSKGINVATDGNTNYADLIVSGAKTV